MNLYDSHDTDRVASMIKNPNREFDRDASLQNNLDYNASKPTDARIQPTTSRRVRLGAT